MIKHEKKIIQILSKLFKEKKFKPDAILDLHGYNIYSAKLVLQKYVLIVMKKKYTECINYYRKRTK